MNNEDTIKNLHLYEDEETIQKTIHYLELHDPDNANWPHATIKVKFIICLIYTTSLVSTIPALAGILWK